MNGPKALSAGEGGFLLTDDDELYHRALLHGNYNKRCRTEIPVRHPLYRYATTGMGLKFHIHPLAAAIALEQLGQSTATSTRPLNQHALFQDPRPLLPHYPGTLSYRPEDAARKPAN